MRSVLPLLNPELGQRSQVAIRYALGHQGISGIVVGLAELEHLRLAIGAAEMGPLPGEIQSQLESLADSNFNI